MKDNQIDKQIIYLEAQVNTLEIMYNKLLESYKKETELRITTEINFKNLYSTCINNGWIKVNQSVDKPIEESEQELRGKKVNNDKK